MKNITRMKEGAVTLLDILGWKGIWQRKSDALESYRKLVELPKTAIKIFTSATEMVGEKTVQSRLKSLKWHVIGISDTIAIVTFGECDLALQFHALISSVTIVKSLDAHIPVRGATCYGKFMLRNKTMVGPAIDEVASWYEKAEWIGVFQTPSALYRTDVRNYVLRPQTIVNYEVPIKGHSQFVSNCANWPMYWQAGNDEKGLKRVFLELNPITPVISAKLENTLKFYKHCKKKGLTTYRLLKKKEK